MDPFLKTYDVLHDLLSLHLHVRHLFLVAQSLVELATHLTRKATTTSGTYDEMYLQFQNPLSGLAITAHEVAHSIKN